MKEKLGNIASDAVSVALSMVDQHPNVHIHYTTTYSSWLNQIELRFSRLKRDVLTRGVFKSVNDLDNKLMRFIREHNKRAAPYKDTYSDSSKRIPKCDSVVTVHQNWTSYRSRPRLACPTSEPVPGWRSSRLRRRPRSPAGRSTAQ